MPNKTWTWIWLWKLPTHMKSRSPSQPSSSHSHRRTTRAWLGNQSGSRGFGRRTCEERISCEDLYFLPQKSEQICVFSTLMALSLTKFVFPYKLLWNLTSCMEVSAANTLWYTIITALCHAYWASHCTSLRICVGSSIGSSTIGAVVLSWSTIDRVMRLCWGIWRLFSILYRRGNR